MNGEENWEFGRRTKLAMIESLHIFFHLFYFFFFFFTIIKKHEYQPKFALEALEKFLPKNNLIKRVEFIDEKLMILVDLNIQKKITFTL